MVVLVIAAINSAGWAFVFGQNNPPADSSIMVLTLDEALRLAADRNKDIQKAKLYRQLVLGKYLEERSYALPQVLVQSSIVKADDRSQKAFGGDIFQMPTSQRTYNIDAGMSWTIFTWGQLGAAIRAAKEGMGDAEDQLRIYRQAVARDVTAAFNDVLLARELHALAKQNLEQKERHRDEAANKFEAGVATDYDILAARVAVDNARPEVIRSENLIRLSRERLRFLVGLEGREVDASGKLDIPPEKVDLNYDQALATALKNRPELAEMGHRLQISRELIKVAAAGDKPRLEFRSGVGFHGLKMGNGSANGVAMTIGLYATFPAFDAWRTKGRLVQARSDVDSLSIERSKLADSIALQVRDALNVLRESEEIMKALSSTVEQAERLLAMAEKGYELGVKTRLDVDDAQLNVMQAKSNLAKARRDDLVARTTLIWVMGTLPDPGEAQH